jgi:hypothetical protein
LAARERKAPNVAKIQHIAKINWGNGVFIGGTLGRNGKEPNMNATKAVKINCVLKL